MKMELTAVTSSLASSSNREVTRSAMPVTIFILSSSDRYDEYSPSDNACEE